MTAEGYRAQLVALLPRGVVWEGEKFLSLLRSFGEEVYRVASMADLLTAEAIATTTDALLPEYERLVGLPFPGFSLAGDNDSRRLDVVGKLIAQGGASAAYFVTIAERRGHAGSYVTDGIRPFHSGSRCGTPLYGVAWVYVWTLHLPDTEIADELLEYIVRRYKPAHTVVLFEYAPPI